MAENITAHMDKSLESLKHNFSKVRTGRANANILSDITVDYYGVPTPVTQVAAVKAPEAHMLLIEPWDKALINAIVKAIGGGLEISMSEENKRMRQHRMSRVERQQTIERLTKEMKEAARLLQFELAAQLRDEIARLERGEDPTAADTSERKATAKKRKGRGKYKS